VIIAEEIEGEGCNLVVNSCAEGEGRGPSRRGLRRSPQGDARGPRHPDRRHGNQRHGIRSSRLENVTIDAGAREEGAIDKDNTTIIDGRGKKKDIERPGRAAQAASRGDDLRL